ncbi:MAG: MBL fold metallo-hydrolase [Candidatus Diapherotrites archaeon]
MEFKGTIIEWLCHACFKIKTGNNTIYTDPFNIKENEKASIVLVTHEHFDHCSPEDIAKIASPETIIVCNSLAAQKLSKWKTVPLKAGQSFEAKEVKIFAVPSYNVSKPFHPKGIGTGFVFETGKVRFYIAGDTDFIPEMNSLKGKVDVAFLPVDGTYTMSAEDAVKAVQAINPEIAIPMHYGGDAGNGTIENAKLFAKLCGKKAVLLEKNQ